MTSAVALAPGLGEPLPDGRSQVMAPLGTHGLDALQGLVRDCVASGVGRHVLLLRTDLLPPRLTRLHHLQLARAALEPLMTAERARTHDLPTGRLAVSWRGDAPMLLQQSLGALEHLLGDGFRVGPAALQTLIRLFDLPQDGAALLDAAGLEVGAEAAPCRRHAASVSRSPPPLVPLDTSALSAMERQLAAADMARFARRKPICRLDGDHVHLAWEKRYLSISELTATLAPGRSAQADAWLFRRLTRILDRRMLALLSAPQELRSAGPFSLNLNVGSMLSPEFLRFDAVLPAENGAGLRAAPLVGQSGGDHPCPAASWRRAVGVEPGRRACRAAMGARPGDQPVPGPCRRPDHLTCPKFPSSVRARRNRVLPLANRRGTPNPRPWTLSKSRV